METIQLIILETFVIYLLWYEFIFYHPKKKTK